MKNRKCPRKDFPDIPIYTEIGPNLTNSFGRVNVTVVGNLDQYEILGTGKEKEFFPILKSTKSWIYFDNNFYELALMEEIEFEYAFNRMKIRYRNAKWPFYIQKTFSMHPQCRAIVLKVEILLRDRIENQKPIQITYLEQAQFALGDPYYNMYSSSKDGFSVSNRLGTGLHGGIICPKDEKRLIWARKIDIQYQVEQIKELWQEDYQLRKCCEDSYAIIQVPLTITEESMNSKDLIAAKANTCLIIYGGGENVPDAMEGIDAILELYFEDHFEAEYEAKFDDEQKKFWPIQTPDEKVDVGVATSVKNMYQIFKNAKAELALPGHMYPRMYSRDSYWQMKGLLAIGEFERSKHLSKFS